MTEREHTAFSIYDGRQFLGEVVEQAPGRFEAADADGRILGVFPNPNAASDAVLASRRQEAGVTPA